MKKFLSYIITFVTLFVMSAVVTVRLKSELLVTNQPTTSAGASGQTSLLAGIMDSINTNPKLDVSGDINISTNNQTIGVQLNANIDLTTLTNPSIMGSVSLNVYGQNYEILLTYTQTDIYITCGNVSVQAKVADITQVAGLFTSVIGNNITLPDIQMPQLDLDSVMAALSNPVKTVVDGINYYQITLPEIAKVTIVCDDNFNIQNISIDELYIIKDASVICNLNVNQDSNINVTAPNNNSSYLDVAALVDSFIKLQDKNVINAYAWSSIYKNNRLYQKVDTNACLSVSSNSYNLENTLTGALEGNLNIKYLNDTIYAQFNEIGLQADKTNIQELTDLLSQEIESTTTGVVSQSATLVNDLMDWLKNNYQSILENAVVSSNQIVLVANLNGILGQNGTVKFILGLENNSINSVRISGLTLGEYTIHTSLYISNSTTEKFEVDTNKYYNVSNIIDIVNWLKDIKTLDISADLQVSINNNVLPLDISAKIDLPNNAQQISTNLYNLSINIYQQNGVVYLNINDIYVSVNNQTIGAIISQLNLQELSGKLDKITAVASSLSINEILSLVNITTTNNTINIVADLSAFVGKTLMVDVSLEFNNGVVLTVNKIAYDNIAVSGTVDVANTTEIVSVPNAETYLNVENFVDYVDEFIASNDYTISGEIDLSTNEFNQKFVGDISVNFANTNIKIDGKLVGKVNADIQLVCVNQKIYLSYNNQHFVVSEQQIANLLTEFNIDIVPLFNQINQVVEIKNNFNLIRTLENLMAGIVVNTGLSNNIQQLAQQVNIDQIISIVSAIKITKSSISANLLDLGINAAITLVLNTNLGVQANVCYDNYIANANISISTNGANYNVTNNYIDLDCTVDTVKGIVNTAEDSQFNGTISFTWGTAETQKISATYNISIIDGKLYAKVVATYLEQDVTIYVLDSTLYVNIKGVYVKATLNQIQNILKAEIPSEIQQQITNFVQQLEQTSADDILKQIEDITSQTIIEKLELNNNVLTVVAKGVIAKITTQNQKVSKVELEYKGFTLSATINSSQEASVPQFDTSSYQDIDNVYALVKNVYNYALGGEYYFNVNLNMLGYDITGYVGYDTSFVAQLSTTLLNKNLAVTIADNIVYINFDGFNASIAFADIPEFVLQINTQFSLNLPQEILDIVDWIFNANSAVNINQTLKNITDTTQVDYIAILQTLSASLYKDSLVVGYNNLDAIINFANNMLNSINVNYLLGADSQTSINATLTLCSKQQIVVPSTGLNLSTATSLLKDIASLVKATNYAGNFTLTADKIELTGTYNIVIQNGELSACINTSFYNIPIQLTIVNNTIYASVDGIKIYLPLTELNSLINWINSSFNTNIQNDINVSANINNMFVDSSLDNINIGELVVSIVNNLVSVDYNDLSVSAQVGTTTNLTLKYGKDLVVNLDLQTANNTISVIATDYLHYSKLTEIVDSLVELYKGKKISATAFGYVYEGSTVHYTADCAIQIDLENLNFYANISVKDHFKNSTITFMLAYNNDYWYVDYNNLKLKIVQKDLTEILAILLEFVGIDASLLPFLEGVTSGLSINLENLKHLVPKLDFGDPLSLIDVFEQLKLKENNLYVVIDNKLISDKLNVDNMTASLTTNNGKLSSIELTNLYTGITDYEYLNFTLTMNEFTGVSAPTEGTYIDISGANELIKAVINTSELTYFEIDGSVRVNGNLIGININWDIPLNVKIKLDENSKPEIMITLGEIPAMAGVNNDIPYEFGDLESSGSRMWYMYYKDGYVYMLREDRVDWYRIISAGERIYQKQLKAHIDSVLADPLYYLQWGVGFTDTIMDAIEASLAKSEGHTPDLGKVINSFVVNDKKSFTVSVNMYEITNDPMMGDMTIGLGVVNNESTGGKNYVGTATFNLYMPIANVFKLTLDSNNLTLINIGKELDFSALYNFINNYTGKEGIEYERTWDVGKAQTDWEQAAERQYTIFFEEQGGQNVADISGKPGQPITLPTLANKVVVDSTVGKRYTYTFAGWYTTELCQNGTEFNSTEMPRSDKVLYAKWVLAITENVITISFNSNGGSAVESVSGFAGTWVDVSYKVPTKEATWVDNGYIWYKGQWEYVFTYYTFDGWYLDSACTKKFDGYYPDSNITLYAKWKTSTETKYLYSWDRP